MRFKEAGNFIMNKLKKELPDYLSYHSVEHIEAVWADAAERIGRQREYFRSRDDSYCLRAVWYHDAKHI